MCVCVCVCVGHSLKHVPGFIERAEELKSKGVDDILLVSGISQLNFCFFLFSFFNFFSALLFN